MKRYLLVDGYNVINAWPVLDRLKDESFEHARIKLIEILNNYSAFKETKVIIVFDAHLVKGGRGKKEKHGCIDVIYTKEGIIADMVIEKLVKDLPEKAKIYVATSDKVEQEVIWGGGAYRVSSRELLEEVKKAKKQARSFYKKKTIQKCHLSDGLNEEIRKTLERMRRGQ